MLAKVIEKVSFYGLLAILFLVVSTKSDEPENSSNYIATSYLLDGEKEHRMRFGDSLVLETSVTRNISDDKRKGLLLRQVASGPHFLQLIYKITEDVSGIQTRKKLVECEIINDWGAANQFRNKFRKELLRAGLHLQVPENKEDNLVLDEDEEDEDLSQFSTFDETNEGDAIDLDQGLEEFRNVSVQLIQGSEIPSQWQKSLNLKAHQRQCKRLHRKLKEAAGGISHANQQEDKRRLKREAFRVGIMPGTLWCGDGSLAEKYESMGAHVGTDRCCREHDGCPFLIDAMSSNYGLFNYRMHTLSHCTCDESFWHLDHSAKRMKRELDNALRLPGTEWCGRGYSAKDMTHLGGFTGADNCCRFHDIGCPFYIEGFQMKYGLYNWRMYTVNHCACDERFRSCLKQTNTGASNFVGKIFFNVVQTKCFLLKPERSCAKRSWWGKCLKYEFKKQAHLRDPIPY